MNDSIKEVALGGDGAARLRVGVAPGFPGVGETHVVETDACVDVPGRDGVERKELCGGCLAAGRFGADVPRQLFARNAPCAAVAGCRSQLDFPAVVAQRKAVAAYGRHDAERIEVSSLSTSTLPARIPSSRAPASMRPACRPAVSWHRSIPSRLTSSSARRIPAWTPPWVTPRRAASPTASALLKISTSAAPLSRAARSSAKTACASS